MSEPGQEDDRSHGYDRIATSYATVRERGRVGAEGIRAWARSLPPGASVLDLGCGAGDPVSTVLVEEGMRVWGIDASPRMVEAYHARFPHAGVACEAVEVSRFFDRAFDGVVAIGLLFLLPAQVQRRLIARIAPVIRPGGRLLFTAPQQACAWKDTLTGRASVSLGAEAYAVALRNAGLDLFSEFDDEGENHHYDARRR